MGPPMVAMATISRIENNDFSCSDQILYHEHVGAGFVCFAMVSI